MSAEGPVTLSPDAARDLAARALAAAGVDRGIADTVARALVEADADGLASHGLARVPHYADQAASGKVDGRARPALEWTAPGTLRVDARDGFAFPALAAGLEAALERLPAQGVVAFAVRNSHHAGVLGHPVERAARGGALALGFTNSPAAIAPWGGREGSFGTNPIAFACPRAGAPPLVVDLSLSKVARGKIMVARERGEPIPEGWALDAGGRPTTDPAAALAGTMVPMGDAKGAALALVVEVLAAALAGARFAFEASSFFTAEGPPPRIGQSFVLVAPERLAGDGFAARLETLLAHVLGQPGVRLPGSRRLEARARAAREGLRLPAALHAELERRAAAR